MKNQKIRSSIIEIRRLLKTRMFHKENCLMTTFVQFEFLISFAFSPKKFVDIVLVLFTLMWSVCCMLFGRSLYVFAIVGVHGFNNACNFRQ